MLMANRSLLALKPRDVFLLKVKVMHGSTTTGTTGGRAECEGLYRGKNGVAGRGRAVSLPAADYGRGRALQRGA